MSEPAPDFLFPIGFQNVGPDNDQVLSRAGDWTNFGSNRFLSGP